MAYALWALLALIVVGFLCGRQGLLSVHRRGRSLTEDQRRQLGFRRKMPCHATLTETIRAIDADELAALFGRVVVVDDNDTHRHIRTWLLARTAIPSTKSMPRATASRSILWCSGSSKTLACHPKRPWNPFRTTKIAPFAWFVAYFESP